MKSHSKYFLGSFALVILLALSGCEFVLGPKMTPDSDPEDLWVSSEPDISFVGLNEETGGATGQLVKDGEVIEVVMVWGYGSHFEIWRDPMEDADDLLVRGKCNFSRDEGTVQIVEDIGNIFDGVEELHFVRENRSLKDTLK